MERGSVTALLAEDIADRRTRGATGPVLFLGAACSRAAHTPRVADIAREVLDQLREDVDLETPPLPPADADDDVIVPAFRSLVLALPPIQRRALALHASAGVPVPQFFQDMALLVRDGLFSIVMTAAFDALVERALTLLGVRPGQSLRIVDVGDDPSSPLPSPSGVTLIKVQGMRVPGPIQSPVIVAGHERDDPEILDALAAPGEPVWWVSPSPPPDGLDAVRDAREVLVIEGPSGHPDRFFGELAVLTVQMPAVNILADPVGSHRKSPPLPTDGTAQSVSTAIAAIGGTTPPEDDQAFERQFLEGRLRRSEEMLSQLPLQLAGGAIDSTLEQQITYQRREVALLEEKLRALESNRSDLRDVLAQIERSPEARSGTAAADYLRATLDRIRTEYARDEPDEDVVSGALAAVAVLGTRLRISPTLLHRLDAYSPSAQGIAS